MPEIVANRPLQGLESIMRYGTERDQPSEQVGTGIPTPSRLQFKTKKKST